MPELAEVEHYRRQWAVATGRRVTEVSLHAGKRLFRGTRTSEIRSLLPGAVLRASEAHGKQMLFRFTRGLWLGIHLGMTGRLRREGPDFRPGKHDHLVLRLADLSLVFTDPRLFGRVRFSTGRRAPCWWSQLPPSILSPEFTLERVSVYLRRRRGSPVKTALLSQDGFPGVGNWMADEILWRARIHPAVRAGDLDGAEIRRLWKQTRRVSERAIRIIAPAHADPPRSWLFPHRWVPGGRCPRTGAALVRERIGGRTTCWSPGRQIDPRPGRDGGAGISRGAPSTSGAGRRPRVRGARRSRAGRAGSARG
jgi:formamidopyrimidine-DNA glycosylase